MSPPTHINLKNNTGGSYPSEVYKPFNLLSSFIATPTKTSTGLTETMNRRYYQKEEDYDWVKAVDDFIGLESFFHRAREKLILSVINKYAKGGLFLDVGCGTGLILRHLPKGSVGVDINPRSIERARVHAPKSKLIIADIEKLPFKDSTFSTIVCTDVLEHVLVPNKALGELYRILQPKGKIIGTVPGRSPLWRLRFLSSTRPKEPYHRYFKRQELSGLLKRRK
ncbi:class I SAM-dependent methyltransferase, partial [Patescibacteria group bacterium]|nr:class I SAM-dependent methyltransferase [Patescibacteria group bacterium]